MTPVCFYIDGFNLYHAIDRLNDHKLKWLDLHALARRLMSPRSEVIVRIYYFSAYATWLADQVKRHEQYVRALNAVGVTCVMGHFKVKDKGCFNCGAKWQAHEEKETDVSIGVTMVRDAFRGIYERAYLITRDSDIVPAVKMIRTEFPSKSITVVAPPHLGHSNDLTAACSAKKKITVDQLNACLLPERVIGVSGAVVAQRPRKYS